MVVTLKKERRVLCLPSERFLSDVVMNYLINRG